MNLCKKRKQMKKEHIERTEKKIGEWTLLRNIISIKNSGIPLPD